MWSGPRNISTAMMRAWENRPDTFVTDEPFYACYLSATGIEHPGRDAIITSQSCDWEKVIDNCQHLTHQGCAVHYQKHMTQHMLAEIRLDWINSLINVFLIRRPEEVVASYAQARPDLTAEDLGFAQQHRLYEHVCHHVHKHPLVLTTEQVLTNHEQALRSICDYAGIDFDQSMLHWPAGKRESDGVWAPWWYHNVEQSTGFARYAKKTVSLDSNQQKIAARCQPFYEAMLEHTRR